MNILMVYQSVVDMCASFLMVVIAVVKVDGTGLSRKSSYDQFVCQVWLARQPIWYFVTTSTYGILLTALDRYAAVLRPVWYNNHVRTVFVTVIISMLLELLYCFIVVYYIIAQDICLLQTVRNDQQEVSKNTYSCPRWLGVYSKPLQIVFDRCVQ